VIQSKTHHIKAPCGKFTMHITEAGEEVLIQVDKSGSCRAVLFEAIAKLVSELPREKAINILKHYQCESAIVGNQSCLDKVAKILKEAK